MFFNGLLNRILKGVVVFGISLSLCINTAVLPAMAQESSVIIPEFTPITSVPLPKPTIPVTVDNFVRAESDRVFKRLEEKGQFGTLGHEREILGIEDPLTRGSRDLLYSFGVFDLTTPVTITLPEQTEENKRFQSMRIVNEDNYILEDTTEPGTYQINAWDAGTRYVQVQIRTFVNADDPNDFENAHALQDQVTVTQESIGELALPNWNQEELDRLHEANLALAPFVPDNDRVFGSEEEVDEVRHFIGTTAWGGGSPEAAIYLNFFPDQNDGETPHILTVKDVPVDGFWSISIYNADGFFEENEYNSYSLNDVSATKDGDGNYTIYFAKEPSDDYDNYLYTPSNWNYLVRMYLPRQEVLDGTWHFPEAQPIEAIEAEPIENMAQEDFWNTIIQQVEKRYSTK